MMLPILIACEESQIITKQFRKRGFECYSNDILDCSGGHPEWHIKKDCREVILQRKWGLIIMHPPCTYTCLSGNRWYHKSELRKTGILFTKEVYELANSVCDKVVLEQPKTIMTKYIGRFSQIINPFEFGHPEKKETWLWINGLPLLKSTKIVNDRKERIFLLPPSKDRSILRSKTYPGIAKAIVDQWSYFLT